MSDTVTLQELCQSFSMDTGMEFKQDIASHADKKVSKSLSIVAEFAGLHDERIIGAHICFRVVSHGRTIAETDDIQAAIDVYNEAR